MTPNISPEFVALGLFEMPDEQLVKVKVGDKIITDDESSRTLAELEDSFLARCAGRPVIPSFAKDAQRRTAQAEWEQDSKLEKAFSRERKMLMLKSWMSERLALGETAEGLIEHAAKHDQGVALMLRECAGELERETA